MIVIGIKFKNTGKIYYFNPKNIDFEEGEGAIVETARGLEYGKCVIANKDVAESQIVQPLKEVVRKATEDDMKRLDENERMKNEALAVMHEKIKHHKLEMKVVDAEYTFDRAKLIFYFTAESRVDFRDLVKELASVFKVRIELRQIYERDDTKMRGALAACGRTCCCASHLPDFEKVSIKMAKIQGLSLNPTKISGVCGRLMCCLKYENDYYNEVFKLMPKVRSTVTTPDGEGVVESNDIIKQQTRVRVLLKDGNYDIRTYKLEDLNIKSRQVAPTDNDGDSDED